MSMSRYDAFDMRRPRNIQCLFSGAFRDVHLYLLTFFFFFFFFFFFLCFVLINCFFFYRVQVLADRSAAHVSMATFMIQLKGFVVHARVQTLLLWLSWELGQSSWLSLVAST